MKKMFVMAFAAVACGMVFTSCSKEDNTGDYPYRRVLTFEDADYQGKKNMLGIKDWSSLIDDAQYDGSLLYNNEDEKYGWYDQGNTYLASDLLFYPFWSGGEAISNYVEQNLANGSYLTQLAVPTNGGHNGSKNFAVHFGYMGYTGPDYLPYIYFKDGKERTIDHMYVVNTTYTLNVLKNGDGWGTNPLPADGWFKIIATGFDKNDNQTGVAEFYLAKDGKCVENWTKFDLSKLGKVLKVKFDMDGTDQGAWGLNTPAYFAYDDVEIVM